MDHKQFILFGTPLKSSIDNDSDSHNKSSLQNTRARLNRQQTVTDAQGRQRFHGAFTGGFSAGYYNTVDSAEGFQPRQFVSHRETGRAQDGKSKFAHRPEDYMDDEDLGEFGIAPKKIRIQEGYSDSSATARSHNTQTQDNVQICLSSSDSIGEKLLKEICSRSGVSMPNLTQSVIFESKSDYHGIGYKPLTIRYNTSKHKQHDPVRAIIGHDRLAISGQAFGTGVLEEEDDDMIDCNELMNSDDINAYNFDGKEKAKADRLSHARTQTLGRSTKILDAFVEGTTISSTESIQKRISNDFKVPDTWTSPRRRSVDVSDSYKNVAIPCQSTSHSALLGDKFTSGTRLNAPQSDVPVGLVSLDKLRETIDVPQAKYAPEPEKHSAITLTRTRLEWRPCSLLCKRFNVPNPFPNTTYFGLKPTDLDEPKPAVSGDIRKEDNLDEIASLEFRRSIFNVAIEFPKEESHNPSRTDTTDDEYLPQVVELTDTGHPDSPHEIEQSDVPEVEIITVPKKEPEVIVLSSDSCSSDSSLYGPPLPP